MNNAFKLLENGDPMMIALLGFVFLLGVALGHLLKKAPQTRRPRTKAEIQEEFLTRIKDMTREATDIRNLQIRQEQLQVAFRTLYGFNPMDPLPPE